jgi:nitrogen fixation/metabolism regulation signal transduction histidine kinase
MASGNRMARMIEDMLDLARARLAGGILIKREPADFKALVERVVREHQAAAPARVIESSFEGDCNGEWDAERIAQVASNLIGNASREPTGIASRWKWATEALLHPMYWRIYSTRSGRARESPAAAKAWDWACTSCPRSYRRIREQWMSKRGRGTGRRFGFNSRAQFRDEGVDLFHLEGFDEGADIGS